MLIQSSKTKGINSLFPYRVALCWVLLMRKLVRRQHLAHLALISGCSDCYVARLL